MTRQALGPASPLPSSRGLQPPGRDRTVATVGGRWRDGRFGGRAGRRQGGEDGGGAGEPDARLRRGDPRRGGAQHASGGQRSRHRRLRAGHRGRALRRRGTHRTRPPAPGPHPPAPCGPEYTGPEGATRTVDVEEGVYGRLGHGRLRLDFDLDLDLERWAVDAVRENGRVLVAGTPGRHAEGNHRAAAAVLGAREPGAPHTLTYRTAGAWPCSTRPGCAPSSRTPRTASPMSPRPWATTTSTRPSPACWTRRGWQTGLEGLGVHRP